jgi:hypothetical protein
MSELVDPRLRAANAAPATLRAQVTRPRLGPAAERLFYLGLAATIVAAIVLGFSRTFFLRPWFADWARAHSPTETFFYLHGVVFTAWLLLLLVQPSLVAAGRVDLHRRLGVLGGVLAVAMVVVGTVGSLVAAARPTGFVDLPVPPLQFLIVPLGIMVLFCAFVTLALVNRHRPQIHKRYMLLASIALVEAGVARWPFAVMAAASPVPGFGTMELFTDLFLVPMVIWDLVSRGRLHPITLWGGLAVIAAQPLRAMLGATPGWIAFAGWLVSLLPG